MRAAISAAKDAASAEIDRLKLLGARQAMRGAYGAGALLFAIAIFFMLHITGWLALSPVLGPLGGSATVLGIDVVIAGLLAWLAARSAPGRAERDAELRRDRAVRDLRVQLALGIAVPVLRHLLRTKPEPSASKRSISRHGP